MSAIKLFRIITLLIIPCWVDAQNRIHVVDFSATQCAEPTVYPEAIQTRIIQKKIKDGILDLKIGTTETCCLTFKAVVKFYSSRIGSIDTLYVGYKSNGEECECTCYYELNYKIKGLHNLNFEVQFKGNPIEYSEEKYKTYPVKYKLIGNDTVNFVDKYGLRQGIWTPDSTKIKKYYFFKDDVHIREVILFDNGNIHKAMKRQFGNWNYFIEYFDSGQKKQECFNEEIGGSYREGNCKEWNKGGQLIYEGPFEKTPNSK